jgi:hypothetical protein
MDRLDTGMWAVALAAAVSLAPAAARADEAPTNDGARGALSARVGLGLPGNMTPTVVTSTGVGFGFAMQLEGSLVPHKYFEVGPFIHFSIRPYERHIYNSDEIEGGPAALFSGGAAAKLRVPFSDRLRGRVGLYVGYNGMVQTLSGEAFFGQGLGIGATAEMSFDVARRIAVVGQIGFLSQAFGGATLPEAVASRNNVSRDQFLAFPPVAFLAFGPEIFF